MSLSKILSNTDQNTQYAVYGWIRIHEKALNVGHIPVMISAICIMYYRKDDIFEIAASGIKILSNGRIITRIGKEGFGFSNVYGLHKIQTDDDNQKVYQWSLRMNKVKDDSVFGLCSKVFLGSASFRSWEYIYNQNGDVDDRVNGEYTRKYGDKLKEGDILTIELDLNHSQIKYFVNGNDKGIAFKNIKRGKDIKYRLQIALCSVGSEVEIISYKES